MNKYIDINSQNGETMLNKVKSYFRFWNKDNAVQKEGAKYGGFKLDIDKYYKKKKNQEKLKKINNSDFAKIFDKKEQNSGLQPS